ncbi:hypothetical protein IRJ41_024400 [Triplophysa rosa]|uniref:Uncharacterized protein n=1 Tax=Triplophysa rosa TaxID=992332 RepID=A0A9W8C738_TRIRA|nr:hypothetical protein IRJ41_024400 [Triplophysa rosa]
MCSVYRVAAGRSCTVTLANHLPRFAMATLCGRGSGSTVRPIYTFIKFVFGSQLKNKCEKVREIKQRQA